MVKKIRVMKFFVYLIVFFLCHIGIFAQDVDRYQHYLDSGIVAIKANKTEIAFHFYMKAFSEKMPNHPFRIYESAVLAVRMGYIDLSFILLNLAIDKSYSNLEHIKNNKEFPALNDIRFEKCLKK